MILLDTNALLWLVADSPRLGLQARARIEAADRVCFSAVSVSALTRIRRAWSNTREVTMLSTRTRDAVCRSERKMSI